jgi:hypothetical protein
MKKKVNEIYETITIRTREEAEMVAKQFAQEGYNDSRHSKPFSSSSTGVGIRVIGKKSTLRIVLNLRDIGAGKLIKGSSYAMPLPVKLREFIYQFYVKSRQAVSADLEHRNQDNIRQALSVLLAYQLEI